jgi:hypothetical protein
VNAHAAAVVPGMGVSVSTVLSELERQPGEFIVDPWVSERATLVAEQRRRVAAAAHLLRYYADERAGKAYRGSGEIHWLVFWPEAPAGNPYWPDATEAAQELIAACIRQLEEWGISRQDADGDLPVPGVYGVPEQWPHIRRLYQRAGFTHAGHTEVVYLTQVADLPHPAKPPIAGVSAQRSVGMNGTRLSAVLGEEAIGYIEVETHEEGERLSRHGGWANIGNLHIAEQTPPRSRDLAAGTGGRLAPAGTSRAAPRLRVAGRPRSHWPGLHRLPGVPRRIRLQRTHPHQARMDADPAPAMMIGRNSRDSQRRDIHILTAAYG